MSSTTAGAPRDAVLDGLRDHLHARSNHSHLSAADRFEADMHHTALRELRTDHAELVEALEADTAEMVTLVARLPEPLRIQRPHAGPSYTENIRARIDANRALLSKIKEAS